MSNYGILELTATSPVQSFTEPLTRAEVKSYLGLPEYSPADTSRDDEIDMLIEAARERAEHHQNRDLVAKQWDLTLDAFPAGAIELRDGLSTVDLVRYRDSDGVYTTLVVNTDYIVDTVRCLIMPPYGDTWPSFTAWPTSAVLVRFTVAAPNAFPERLKKGMKLLISHWFNGKLPFEIAPGVVHEYPETVSALLSSGAKPRRFA